MGGLRSRRTLLASFIAATAILGPPAGPFAPATVEAASASVERLAGSDRYETAAAISRATFAAGAAPAFIASGLDFPDALAGGPAAGRVGGPILLTRPDALPPATRTELSRLQSTGIVVLGGPSVVSPAVETELAAYTTGSVTRIAGANRYATAAAISAAYFPTGVPVAYIATGHDYPDALGAGAAAAARGGPVLLVGPNDLQSVVRAELSRLKPARIIVAGGRSVVGDAVLAALDGYTTGSVTRQAGSDRYATAAALSRGTFAGADVVHLASGLGFPDALAGVPAAAALGGPLLLSMRAGLPEPTATELSRLAPRRVRLLGGPSVLGDSIPAAVRSATAMSRVGPFSFRTDDLRLKSVPADYLAFHGTTRLEIYGTRDATGAFIFKHTDGRWYDHPVGQAQYIVNMLRNYRLRPDQEYLDLAIANGNRLLERAVRYGGGIFFPYAMDYELHGRGTMRAPWYSGMAQGIALAGFVRLHEVTGDARWLQAAHDTFASFKVPREAGKPWFTVVENGNLWFEEYPWVPYDHTFNGHNFATYGLYDYWRHTGSHEAEQMAIGGMTTSARVAGTVRVVGGVSQYCIAQSCLDRLVRNRQYHLTHIGQFIQLHRYTNAETFARLADAFTTDYPEYRIGGTVVFEPATHTGYTFDSAGIGRSVKSTTNTSGSSAPYRERSVPYGWIRPGNGVWFFMSAGYFEGLWVRESGAAYARGFVDRLSYLWQRPVSVGAGTRTGYAFDSTGTITGTASVNTAAATWTFSARARINGMPAVLLASGPLSGYWLPVTAATGATALAAAEDELRSPGAPAVDFGTLSEAPLPPAPPEDPLIPPPMPGQQELGPADGPPEDEAAPPPTP